MRILAIDGGLAATGMAIMDVDRTGTTATRREPMTHSYQREVTHGEVWRSKSVPKKKRKQLKLHGVVDRVSRARTLAATFDRLIRYWHPTAVVAEELNIMRGIHANVAAGLVWGALAAICEVHKAPLYSVTVQAWRAHARATLYPTVEDEEGIHRAITWNVEGAAALVAATEPAGARVHLLDAIGVGWWAAHQPEILEGA